MPLALDPFPLSFDAHTALQDVAHRSDAIVTMPTSKAVQLAASGMIDARHGVDAMTLASSPVHAMRDSRFGQFPGNATIIAR